MATGIPTTRNIVDALKAEGFELPKNCREARLVMGINQMFVVQYDVFLDGEDLARLGRALQQIGDDCRCEYGSSGAHDAGCAVRR